MTKINQPQGSSNSSRPSEWHQTPLTSSRGKAFQSISFLSLKEK